MLKRTFLSLAAAAMVFVGASDPAWAEDPILTVNDLAKGTSVAFTRTELLALPQRSFDTGTIWSDGVDTYAGPTLAGVLAAAGVEQGNLRLHAVNDYNVNFPAERVEDEAPILAIEINGEPFSMREKGPIWVVFPFDDNPDYKTEDTFALSVWHLDQIDRLAE